MGHARPDMDCMGAAMGIVRCAQFSQKCSRIVLDQDRFMIEPFINGCARKVSTTSLW